MYERFTDRARKVMQLANEEAQRFNHEYIGTEHILLALIKEGEGIATLVLKNLDIDLRKVRREVEKIVVSGPDNATIGKLPQTPRAKKVIEYAIEEARNLNHNYVGTEHVLLGILREEGGVAAQVLINLGLKLERVREELFKLVGLEAAGEGLENQTARRWGKELTPTLDSFCLDLSALARLHKLDPFVVRKNELERITWMLGCRSQNNPLLVGEVGVGKTALIEGLAKWSNKTDCPVILRGRRLIELNLASLVAQTTKISNFQEAITGCVNEARRAKDILLVLSTLPRLARASGSDPALDALQAALHRSEIQCIGAVTPEEYRVFIANDTALGRQFRPIQIRATSRSETVAILSAHGPGLERYHRVQIHKDALEAAVELSESYRMEGCLPGKAMRLLDETCAFVRLKIAPSLPSQTELEARLQELQQEKETAVANVDFERAANLRDQEEQLKKQREDLVRQLEEKARDVLGTIDKAAVAEVVDRIVGMPIPRL